MQNFPIDNNGKRTLNVKNSFCNLISHAVKKSTSGSYDEIFDYMDTELEKEWEKLIASPSNKVRGGQQKSFTGALNNAHGTWYEWLIALKGWNYSIKHKSYRIINLPNKNRFSVPELYEPSIYQLIEDFKEKLNKEDVKLITSNPDFVIVNTNSIRTLPKYFFEPIKISDITPKLLEQVEKAYLDIVGKCEFNDIVGYLALKKTFRPDRIFQLAHEASLMKAIYKHIQTRKWLINPRGIKYYAIATKFSKTDASNLKTVATHSITSVSEQPERAVDDVIIVNNDANTEEIFTKILY